MGLPTEWTRVLERDPDAMNPPLDHVWLDSLGKVLHVEASSRLHGGVMSVATFTWSQPRAFRRCYELRGINGVVGDLRFAGLFTAKAQATLGESVWDIRSQGLRHSQVLLVPAGSDVAEVTFTRHWLGSGGNLDFRGRAPLRMRIAWFRRKLLLQTPAGERVLSLSYRGIVHSRGELYLGPRAPMYEPTVLALIAWYLVVTGFFQTKSDWASA